MKPYQFTPQEQKIMKVLFPEIDYRAIFQDAAEHIYAQEDGFTCNEVCFATDRAGHDYYQVARKVERQYAELLVPSGENRVAMAKEHGGTILCEDIVHWHDFCYDDKGDVTDLDARRQHRVMAVLMAGEVLADEANAARRKS